MSMGCCYKCKKECTIKDDKGQLFGFPCDVCKNVICAECAGISSSEVRVLIMKSRSLIHFCHECRDGLFKNMLQISQKIGGLEDELKKMKNHLKPDEINKRFNCIEDDVKKLKQEEILSELKNKVKTLEEYIKAESSGKMEKNQTKNLEARIIKNISEALEEQMKAVNGQIGKCFREENSRLMQSLSNGFKEVNQNLVKTINNRVPDRMVTSREAMETENNHTAISSKKVGQAIMEVSTKNTLDKYINIVEDVEVEEVVKTNTQPFKPSAAPGRRIKGANKDVLSISAAADSKVFYVGNLSVESSAEKLETYLLENKIPVMACEQIVPKKQGITLARLAYRITIEPKFEKYFLNSNLWPENVTVKPFMSHNNNQREYRSRNFHQRRPQGWYRK